MEVAGVHQNLIIAEGHHQEGWVGAMRCVRGYVGHYRSWRKRSVFTSPFEPMTVRVEFPAAFADSQFDSLLATEGFAAQWAVDDILTSVNSWQAASSRLLSDDLGLFLERASSILVRASKRDTVTAENVPLSDEAERFCALHGLHSHLQTAIRLAHECFPLGQIVDIEKEEDPEGDSEWLAININLPMADVRAVLDAYDRYTEKLIREVPLAERERIQLSYNIT